MSKSGFGTAPAWAVITRVMHLDWVFLPREMAATAVGATVATVLFGFVGVWRALGQKASPLLRNQ